MYQSLERTGMIDLQRLHDDTVECSVFWAKTPSLLSSVDLQKFNTEEFHTPSDDGKFSYIALDLLLTVLLQPYSPQMAIGSGGGGGGNDKGWRDLDDDDKEKYKYRFLNNHQVTASKPKIGYKPRR